MNSRPTSSYLLITITEVNTVNQWVEGIDQMNSPYRIEWNTHSGGITYAPKIGERWIISRLNNSWKLMWRYENADTKLTLRGLLPGDVRIEGNRIHLLAEEVLINYDLFQNVKHKYNEIPGGVKDESNEDFTVVRPYQSGTLRYYRNGMRELVEEDAENGAFTVGIAPASDDDLIVDYDYTVVYDGHEEVI